jgi:hypothetical protein
VIETGGAVNNLLFRVDYLEVAMLARGDPFVEEKYPYVMSNKHILLVEAMVQPTSFILGKKSRM